MGDQDQDTTVSRMPWRLLVSSMGSPHLYAGGNSLVPSLAWQVSVFRGHSEPWFTTK